MGIIFRIAIPNTPPRRLFDYLPPRDVPSHIQFSPGLRVKVPWRNQSRIGILVELAHHSPIPLKKLKCADCILDAEPLLPPSLLKLTQWAAEYYQYGIGEILQNCFPLGLRKKEKIEFMAAPTKNWQVITPTPALNPTQENHVIALQQQKGFCTFLLDGVTGSGKTEVYLQIIGQQLSFGKQALLLVPEIGLTPQTLQRFTARFAAPVVVLHSGLTEKERVKAWLMAKNGEAAIIIGTRSAIFTPFAHLGIIIIDEEHDLSFKQQTGLRYSARDLAIMRAHLENIPILLGSATPSLESLHNVNQKKFQYLSLPQRAGNAKLPHFRVMDIRQKKLQDGLSSELIHLIRCHLDQDNQVLLFLNRRGFASVLLCHHCGWIAMCNRCNARLTLHQHPKKLHCHHCESQLEVPTACQQCQSKELLMLGLGTERLEKALTQLFPETDIIRMDRDSTRRKGALLEKLQQIRQGKKQILLGTQMLTKGHHFTNVTLVAIVNADNYLYSRDFRASERLGQLLIQVAGRAGRGEKMGEVCIQTHFPTHPLLLQLIDKGYADFAQALLQERKITGLPPYSHLAILHAEANSTDVARQFLDLAVLEIKQYKHQQQIQLLGPMPAPLEKKAGLYRMQLFIQSSQRKQLQALLKILILQLEKHFLSRKIRWSLDVDPMEID